MDGFTSTLEPMFNKEGDEINEWIYRHSQTMFRRGGEINGWIQKHSKTHVQERRKGVKWMDSQALTNPCSGEKDRR
jgi:hypothetical protein